jgi:hypothetical protein
MVVNRYPPGGMKYFPFVCTRYAGRCRDRFDALELAMP